jgi:hypothetical protein
MCQPHNNRLQRTVMDKVTRHIRQRAAAEPERWADHERRWEAANEA